MYLHPNQFSPLRWCMAGMAMIASIACVNGTSTINDTSRYAYGANTGWMDWRPDPDYGVKVTARHLAGYIYAANFGWINVGNGAPANGITYSNTNGTDFGVNVDSAGLLRGYAWGANIGWLNFEATGNPRVDPANGAFSGFVWSANCGWIALSNAPHASLVTDTIFAVVTGRHVFYNRSAFDNSNAAADAADDGAIAPDKTPLLNGQIATFANYTSYSRGINGIMVDVAGWSNVTSVSAANFTFRTGNDGAPKTWPLATPPTSVSVRLGAGDNQADRITLIWPDNTFRRSWLQVALLGSPSTPLENANIFYFGNAVGETGNSAANANVTSVDSVAVLGNLQASGATITNRYDFNRSKTVSSADASIALGNLAVGTAALQLINLTAFGSPVSPLTSEVPLSNPSRAHLATVLSEHERLFMEAVTPESGVGLRPATTEIIAVADPSETSDPGEIHVWIRTPTDGPVQILQSSDLNGQAWESVPSERIQSVGDGFHQVRIPTEQAGSNLFFRLAL